MIVRTGCYWNMIIIILIMITARIYYKQAFQERLREIL